MRPYLTHLSFRPGCLCCISVHGHGHRGKRRVENIRNVKRAGKKAMRRCLRHDTDVRLQEALAEAA